jgi:hypothetical protein
MLQFSADLGAALLVYRGLGFRLVARDADSLVMAGDGGYVWVLAVAPEDGIGPALPVFLLRNVDGAVDGFESQGGRTVGTVPIAGAVLRVLQDPDGHRLAVSSSLPVRIERA